MHLALKITGFLTGGLLVLLLLAEISDSLAPVFATERQRVAQLMVLAPTIEVINVGPSHNKAIDYGTLGVAGYHAWFNDSDLKETSYFLKNILPQLPKLRAVMICITPISLHIDNAFVLRRKRVRHMIYFATPGAKSWRPISGEWQEMITGKLANVVRDDHWRKVFNSRPGAPGRKRGVKNKVKLSRDGRSTERDERIYVPNQISKPRVRNQVLAVKSTLKKNPLIATDMAEQLDQTLALLKAQSIQVLLFTPPLTDHYYDSIKQSLPDVVEENRRILHRLAVKHGIRYLDFREHATFSQDYQLFHNSDHMNIYGAKTFSRVLADLTPEIFH